MNAAWRKTAFRRLLLAVWGMATLVLMFTVVLLAVQMAEQGKDPLALVRKTESQAPPPVVTPSDVTATEEVALFFARADGCQLAPEAGRIELTDSTVANCRNALDALIRGPRDILTPILPTSAKVRGIYLLDTGELVVDFSNDVALEMRKCKSATSEGLMLYGIVNTLTQPVLKGGKEVAATQVRFLIEGAAPRDSFPAHMDASAPIRPDDRWIAGAG